MKKSSFASNYIEGLANSYSRLTEINTKLSVLGIKNREKIVLESQKQHLLKKIKDYLLKIEVLTTIPIVEITYKDKDEIKKSYWPGFSPNEASTYFSFKNKIQATNYVLISVQYLTKNTYEEE